MVYGDFKDLTRRTIADKILLDKTFNIAKIPKYDGYQRELVSMFYKFFHKKTNTNKGTEISSENKELAEELCKPIIKKFEIRKVNSAFINNTWGAGLADMQLLSKFNKRIRFVLCAFDIFSKYAWVDLLQDKKGITITDAFQKVLIILDANQTKSGLKKAANFITNH